MDCHGSSSRIAAFKTRSQLKQLRLQNRCKGGTRARSRSSSSKSSQPLSAKVLFGNCILASPARKPQTLKWKSSAQSTIPCLQPENRNLAFKSATKTASLLALPSCTQIWTTEAHKTTRHERFGGVRNVTRSIMCNIMRSIMRNFTRNFTRSFTRSVKSQHRLAGEIVKHDAKLAHRLHCVAHQVEVSEFIERVLCFRATHHQGKPGSKLFGVSCQDNPVAGFCMLWRRKKEKTKRTGPILK